MLIFPGAAFLLAHPNSHRHLCRLEKLCNFRIAQAVQLTEDESHLVLLAEVIHHRL